MKVIGLARRRGEYKGNAYDNMMIYCTRPADTTRDEKGEITEVIKIKTDDFPNIIDIGVDILPVYNRFGYVIDIQITMSKYDVEN